MISCSTVLGRASVKMPPTFPSCSSVTPGTTAAALVDVGGLLADGLRGRLRPDVPIHLAAPEVAFWASPDFSRNTFGGMPDVLRSAEGRFVDEYRSQLRPFEKEYEVAPGVGVRRTGGPTPR